MPMYKDISMFRETDRCCVSQAGRTVSHKGVLFKCFRVLFSDVLEMLLDVVSRISVFVFALATKHSRVLGAVVWLGVGEVNILFQWMLDLDSRTLWSIQKVCHIALQCLGKTQYDIGLSFVDVFAFPFIGAYGIEGNSGFIGKIFLR